MTAPLDKQSSTPIICDEHGNLIQRFHYGYDALGRRITKQDAFGTTLYLWDGDQMVLERRGGNETHTLYLPHSFVPLAQIHNGRVHHLHTDHLGTPLEASNDAGTITWRVTYKTWGNVLLQEKEQITQNLRFQGQYFDQETGLHYNRFRYYDPQAGRFISQDPIGLAGGVNLFQYAPNSTGWVDPVGLAAAGQLGTYGGLTGTANAGDKLDAHELIRNKALEQMGCKNGARMDENPSIALSRGQHVDVHRQEAALSLEHLGTNGKNQFQFDANGKPSKQQMDVWQGALRKAGMSPSQAKRLRKQSNAFLKNLCCC